MSSSADRVPADSIAIEKSRCRTNVASQNVRGKMSAVRAAASAEISGRGMRIAWEVSSATVYLERECHHDYTGHHGTVFSVGKTDMTSGRYVKRYLELSMSV